MTARLPQAVVRVYCHGVLAEAYSVRVTKTYVWRSCSGCHRKHRYANVALRDGVVVS